MKSSRRSLPVEPAGSAPSDSVEAVGLAVENLDRTRSKREFNKFIAPLPALGESPVEPLIIETAVMTPASPAGRMPSACF